MTSTRCAILILAGVAGLFGCSAPGGDARAYRRVVLDDATPEAVFAEAVGLLRREFGSLEIDSQRLEAVTGGAAYEARNNSGAARDLYGGTSTMRRQATLKVASSGPRTIASLRIDLQRRDDDRRDAFLASDSRLTDAPGYTPIERDAARSVSQNTTWTSVGRDGELERALLDELSERFAAMALPEAEAESPPEDAGG